MPAAFHTGLLLGRLGTQHVHDGGLRSRSIQHVSSSLCAGHLRGRTGSEQAALLQGVASAATGWLRHKLQKPRPVKGTGLTSLRRETLKTSRRWGVASSQGWQSVQPCIWLNFLVL